MSHNDKVTATASSRKRARPTIQRCLPKITLVTSLLWLVAFLATHPAASHVKAFVLASDRPTPNHVGPYNNKQQPSLLRKPPHPHLHPQQPFLITRDHYPICSGSDVCHKLFSSTATTLAPYSLVHDALLQVPTNDQGGLDFDWLSSSTRLMLLSSSSAAAEHGETKILPPDEDQVLAWAGRYTSVEALRRHFGGNQNKLWGDLQASTARRLYKTLLPRALLELSKISAQLQPQDLAPLAYQARVAAKLYARERCTIPARIAATLFDGFRQWIKYGKFQGHGMTYDQLWEKYAEKILQETESDHVVVAAKPSASHYATTSRHPHDSDSDDEDVCDMDTTCDDISEQVCRKILERACVSNEAVDSFVLARQDLSDETLLQPDQRQLLERIRNQLEEDMYRLLLPREARDWLPPLPTTPTRRRKRGKFRLVRRTIAKQRRFWKLRHQQKLLAKAAAKEKAANYLGTNTEASLSPRKWSPWDRDSDGPFNTKGEDELKP